MPDAEHYNDLTMIDTIRFDNNGTIDSLSLYIGDQQEKVDAAILLPFIWDHKTLTVSFLDGDPVVIERVKNSASAWERNCGIHFQYGNYNNPDISISFLQRGSWSYIGSYSRRISPSMNLGWLNNNTSPDEIDRVVLHEFGHALGLIHEHLSPSAKINWNKPLVYKYYAAPPNKWDKAKTDINIFNKYDKDQVNATDFDSLSIMLYSIPKSLTLDGFSTRTNTRLSAKDIELIQAYYPL